MASQPLSVGTSPMRPSRRPARAARVAVDRAGDDHAGASLRDGLDVSAAACRRPAGSQQGSGLNIACRYARPQFSAPLYRPGQLEPFSITFRMSGSSASAGTRGIEELPAACRSDEVVGGDGGAGVVVSARLRVVEHERPQA